MIQASLQPDTTCPAGYIARTLPLHPQVAITREVLHDIYANPGISVKVGSPLCRRCLRFSGFTKDDKIKCGHKDRTEGI